MRLSKHSGSPWTEPVEVRPRGEDDAFTILLDPLTTNADFDWCPATLLKSGVARAIEYYQTYGLAETFTHLKIPKGDPEDVSTAS